MPRRPIDLSRYAGRNEHLLRQAHMVVVPAGVVIPAAVAPEVLAALDYAYRTSGRRPSDSLAPVLAELRMVAAHTARRTGRVPPSVPQVDDPDDEGEGWCSTSEAASRLGVSDRAIRGRIARGTIEHRRRGQRWEVRTT